MGGVIDLAVARSIRTRAIGGAANNLLASPVAGDVLSERGIVLAPDFIANSGGAIHLVGREVLGWTAEEVATHVDEIGTTLAGVFAWSREAGVTTEQAAHDLAVSRLS
jgi:leucine dehydrogenase